MAEQTLRETLNAAFEQTESGGSPSSETVDEAPPSAAPDSPPPEPREPAADAGRDPSAPEAAPAAQPDDAAPADEGAKKPLSGAALAASEAKKAREAAEAIQGGIKAPESWRPAVRDKHWKTLPPQVQAEIHRRERQVTEALASTAEARRSVEAVNSLFQQYKDVLAYEKVPPLQTVANLLNVGHALRFSSEPQRAQVMAQVIQGFNVDLQLLDQALAYLYGNTPQQDPQLAKVQQVVSQQLAPIQQHIQSQQQYFQQQQLQAQQQADYELGSEIERFAADPQHEYFEHVREAMADILETAANRGQKVSLDDAYRRAVLADNSIAGAYISAQAKAASSRAAQAAGLAGISVTGSPAQGDHSLPAGADMRAALNAAWSKHTAGVR